MACRERTVLFRAWRCPRNVLGIIWFPNITAQAWRFCQCPPRKGCVGWIFWYLGIEWLKLLAAWVEVSTSFQLFKTYVDSCCRSELETEEIMHLRKQRQKAIRGMDSGRTDQVWRPGEIDGDHGERLLETPASVAEQNRLFCHPPDAWLPESKIYREDTDRDRNFFIVMISLPANKLYSILFLLSIPWSTRC